MRETDTPSPKRKSRAGLIVVWIVLFMALATFAGMNLQHAEEMKKSPTSSPGTRTG